MLKDLFYFIVSIKLHKILPSGRINDFRVVPDCLIICALHLCQIYPFAIATLLIYTKRTAGS